MTKSTRLAILIACAFPLCVIHGWLASYTLGLAFVYGEIGENTPALFLSIATLILAPLLIFGSPLNLLFTDNTAILICTYASAILWWTIIVWLANRWLRPKQRTSDAQQSGEAI